MTEQIEVTVTHEIKIDGDKTWVGTKYLTNVQTGETPEDARARASAVVQQGVMNQIDETVTTVRKRINR